MKSDDVFNAIVSERVYQARKWGVRQDDETFVEPKHSVGDFLVYMQNYLDKAFAQATNETDDYWPLEEIRKVAALAVACMEQHGASWRGDQKPDMNKRDFLPV
jgi:hypothetical protein